ncbi:ATP-dependent zinc metalloprotease FtsH [Gemmata obscuriglobus]|uniref:ATP-binding protein n=1 Tax=Gemmata obscuriglobus TaxID=114 RepID=A0A2Z3H899_9BACT|nr:ATP-binding protein [Gemmata obscuriglobus]AWM37924.1 ATP-binding protein [Gemmata obscuriglobus]QEG29221.1 ATP-dependent zinc metalloprotease FtsH [Gemmata obscuriglobus]VTS08019.1 cell division protein : Cell division cycle protein 48-related protein OS=Blastopirellula marina DSM 3645 GN=DSM3645_00015 PE=3 SV=1: TPR_19: AAA [Gemmata obscuriglobus UQM 2246]
MATPDPLAGLIAAVQLSPDNLPLRKHLAEAFAGLGRFAEAEAEYRAVLATHAQDLTARLGLARLYHQQGQTSQAFVVLESLVRDPQAPAEAHVLLAKLWLREGDIERAVARYKLGVEMDPDAVDAEFASRLGIDQSPDESEVSDGRLAVGDVEEAADVSARLEKPKVRFGDVGGMDAIKEEIQLKIIHPLKHPELYAAYGKAIGGGILMYGPPGCGKTHLARATAGEVNASFIAVGIEDVLDMWLGSSEKNLHALFDEARRNRPCVLFFDEVDALAANRSDLRQSSGRMIINQFLSELDGATTSNEGVLILAATNAPWHLDPAFRRPGRFDRILFVPPPDLPARASILRVLTTGKPQQSIDFEQVAKKADQFSGADLKAVIDLAVEAKLREAITSGVPKPLTTKDLLAAVPQVKPSTKEWFSTARNYATFANQGGQYDDILKYLRK